MFLSSLVVTSMFSSCNVLQFLWGLERAQNFTLLPRLDLKLLGSSVPLASAAGIFLDCMYAEKNNMPGFLVSAFTLQMILRP